MTSKQSSSRLMASPFVVRPSSFSNPWFYSFGPYYSGHTESVKKAIWGIFSEGGPLDVKKSGPNQDHIRVCRSIGKAGFHSPSRGCTAACRGELHFCDATENISAHYSYWYGIDRNLPRGQILGFHRGNPCVLGYTAFRSSVSWDDYQLMEGDGSYHGFLFICGRPFVMDCLLGLHYRQPPQSCPFLFRLTKDGQNHLPTF